MNAERMQRFLLVYSGVLTMVFAACVIAACATASRRAQFEEIDVQRINIIEPGGKVRLVISDQTRFPGAFLHGKEVQRSDRRSTGFLFMNDEGTEMGGLIFGGQKDSNGEVHHEGHLSFDQYDQDQIFAIDAGQSGTQKRSIMVFSDRGDYPIQGVFDASTRIRSLPPAERQAATRQFLEAHPGDYERVLIGRATDGSAIVQLKDVKGRDRIVLRVADGPPRMQFLDENGKVIDRLLRQPSASR